MLPHGHHASVAEPECLANLYAVRLATASFPRTDPQTSNPCPCPLIPFPAHCPALTDLQGVDDTGLDHVSEGGGGSVVALVGVRQFQHLSAQV